MRAFDLINKKGEDVAKTLSKTEKATSSFDSKLNKFSKGLGQFAKKGMLSVTTPFTALSMAAFKSASDTNESLSKSEVVFGKNSNAIKEWSKNSTTAFGASRNEALEMVSKFGAMGKAMGLNTNQTKDYSMNMTQLAGDLASFNNISVDMANTALTGIFTGETEALKGLGIVMTQTNLERYAQSKGIKKKIQDMTQAEQVQLRYNYVMSQTKDAQGDYKRTSNSAANSTKTFRKSIDNLMASFGQFLLAFTPLINVATDLITKFNNLDDGTKKMILTIGAIVSVIFPLLLGISKLVKVISVIHNGFSLLNKGIKTGITGIKNFAKATKNGTSCIFKFSKGISKGAKGVGTFGKNIITTTSKGLKNFGKGTVNATKSVGKFALTLSKKGIKAIKDFTKKLAILTKDGLIKFGKALKNVTKTGIAKFSGGLKALWGILMANPIVLVIGLIVGIGIALVEAYKHCKWFRDGVNKVLSFITNLFKKFSDFLTGVFTTDWTKSFGVFGNIINAFMHNMSNIFGAIKRIFGGLIDFITGVFTGNWSQAWQGVVNIFGGIMDGLGAVIKAPLNAVIGLINMAIDGINSISFTAPDWVPFVGGQHFGVNLGHINYLYNGGIFTQPTLLGGGNVVGDKFKGTGSKAEAVIPLNVLWSKLDAIANRPIILKLNERTLIQFIAEKDKEIDKMKKQLGIA